VHEYNEHCHLLEDVERLAPDTKVARTFAGEKGAIDCFGGALIIVRKSSGGG